MLSLLCSLVIPAPIGQLRRLRVLKMASNKVLEIPDNLSIGPLTTTLRKLWLPNNLLGKIPLVSRTKAQTLSSYTFSNIFLFLTITNFYTILSNFTFSLLKQQVVCTIKKNEKCYAGWKSISLSTRYEMSNKQYIYMYFSVLHEKFFFFFLFFNTTHHDNNT